MRSASVGLVLAGAAILGCGTFDAWRGAAAPARAFEREIELAPAREVTLPGLGLSFRAPAIGDVVVTPGHEIDSVTLDLGTEAPIHCNFHPGPLELASFLVGVSDRVFAPEQLPGLESRAVRHVGSGGAGGHRYLGLHWLYQVDHQVGTLKQLTANAYGVGIHCIHDEAGYDQAFLGAFRSILSTLSSERIPLRPYYGEILTVRLGDQPVGVMSLELHRTGDGATQIDTRQSILMLRSATEIYAVDSFDISLSTADGDLIAQKSLKVEAGDLTMDLDLDRRDAGPWRVRGTFKSKAVDTEFEAPTLRSALGGTLDLRAALAADGERASVTHITWSPDTDLAGPTELETRVTGRSDSGNYTAVQTLGPIRGDLVLDPDGSLLRASTPLGPVVMHMERIWANGEL